MNRNDLFTLVKVHPFDGHVEWSKFSIDIEHICDQFESKID